MGHESVLRAVIRRAYEDLSLRYRKPGDSDSQKLAEHARLWIFGLDVNEYASAEEARLDNFMSFKNLCESLRLPYYEMITYAEKVIEGEHEQFTENRRAIVWCADEYSRGAYADNICISTRAESVLRAERIARTYGDESFNVGGITRAGRAEFSD